MTRQPKPAAEEILQQGAAALHIAITDIETGLLVRYFKELVKWNRGINLIARNTSTSDIAEKHFLDSLTLLPLIKRFAPKNPSLLDVGSGAGFPGLVLKIVFPELKITLVEPRQKRSTFLRHIIRELRLPEIQVITGRIEEEKTLPATSRFSFITSRALAEPLKFLPMIDRFLTTESIIVFMQSDIGANQLLAQGLDKRFELLETAQFILPFSASRRQIILIKPSEPFLAGKNQVDLL